MTVTCTYIPVVVACRHTEKTVQSDHAVMNKKAAIKTYFFIFETCISHT